MIIQVLTTRELMKILFLLLEVLGVACDGRGIDSLVESLKPEFDAILLRNTLSVNDSKLLSYPIIYTFPKKMKCFSVISDGSLFAKAVRSLLYENDLTPSFLNMPDGEQLNCNGFVSITRDMDSLKKHVVELKRDAKSRILCYVGTGKEKEIDGILQNELEIFGDAEFTIFVWVFQEFFYRVGQPNRTMEKIEYIDSKPPGRWQLNQGIIKNFYGRNMRITTDNCTIFSQIGPIKPDGKTDLFVGSDAFIMNAILDKLNLTYSFVKEAEGKRFSEFINGSWVGGLYENLAKKKSDMVVCGSWIERHKTLGGLDMTVPILPICVTYLVRLKISTTRWLLVFKPFDIYLWVILCVTGTVFSGIVTAFSEIMSNLEAFNTTDQRYRSFPYSLYKTYGVFMNTNWPSLERKLGPLRQLFTGWVFFAVLISCAYSSTLISHLTKPTYAIKPNNLHDLVKGGYAWSGEYTFPVDRLWDLNNSVFNAWAKRYIQIGFMEKLELLYTDHKQVIAGFLIEKNVFFPFFSELPTNLTDQFEIMDSCMASTYEAFIMRSGSPFKNSIDYYISVFQQHGLITYYARQASYVKELPNPTYPKTTKKKKSSQLKAEQLEGIFYLLVFGWIFSMGVFGGELLTNRLVKAKRMSKRRPRVLIFQP